MDPDDDRPYARVLAVAASSDGLSWRRAGDYAALGQGEMLAVTRGGPGLVAVGSFGAPDNYIPTIWLATEP